MPAAVIRPAFWRIAAWYQRDAGPLYARTYTPSSTTTDQIHVGVPYVTPSSRNGEMCRSSASAILRSSSFDHVIECLLVNFAFLLAPQIQPRILSPSARTTPSLDGRDSGDTKCRVWIVEPLRVRSRILRSISW